VFISFIIGNQLVQIYPKMKVRENSQTHFEYTGLCSMVPWVWLCSKLHYQGSK